MKINQVAAQLYTLRDFIKTPPEIAATLKKVRKIGYQAVQVSAMGPIPEAELVKMLDGEGLTCCATHEPAVQILAEPERVVERLTKLGCKYTAYPHPAGIDLSDAAQVHDLAAKLDTAGAVLRKAGQILTYHNHAIEFLKINGALVLDTLYSRTSLENLQGELDTYWVQYGGGDPADWCLRLDGRLPLLHMKDYAFTAQDKPVMAEIGYGNLDWKKIIPAAEKAGCQWFIVEQDVCPGDPFDSLKKSFDHIHDELAQN
jgi:sugar phosphate isomerase/epimerase